MSNKITAFLLGLGFFTLGVWTLPHYGINWDTINHSPRGQAYLRYFLTGEKDYTDLPAWRHYWQDPDSLWIKTDIPKDEVPTRSLYQSVGTDFNWYLEHDGNGHPPVSDILASLFNFVFFQKLGLVNDIDSYRIYGVFLAAALVGLIFYWVSKLYGRFAGLISALSLGLYPLFWSESHFNTEKDIPETAFWSFTLFCFWKGVVEKRWGWILTSGVFFGLALGTKFNILFSILIILPWSLIYFVRTKLKGIGKLIVPSIGAGIVGLAIFIGSWPYLWADPISRIIKVFKFYKTIGLTEVVNPINIYPVHWILFTTPIIILILSLIGILAVVSMIQKDKNLTSVFFLFWFLVPIVRVTLPGTTSYGGMRQIMEYIPAMAILAGIGGKYLRDWLAKLSGNKIAYFAVLSLFIPIAFKLVQIHPNENVYFNPLMGGLAGAKLKKVPFWGNSFGAAYRQGVSWINKNAEEGAKVVLAYELLPNIPSIWFRRDLNFHNSARSGYLRQGEYAITLTYQGTAERSYYDSYLEKFTEPVYQSKVDGVAIVKVWKNDDQHLKVPWLEMVDNQIRLIKGQGSLLFDLGKVRSISRLEIRYEQRGCQELEQGHVQISENGDVWEELPGTLPRDWLISILGRQPNDGSFIYPFVGQEARFIKISMAPDNTCLKMVQNYKLFYFSNSKTK